MKITTAMLEAADKAMNLRSLHTKEQRLEALTLGITAALEAAQQADSATTNNTALKNITDQQVANVARAFWRRIQPYAANYGRDLPAVVPVEFMAHMATALIFVDRTLSVHYVELNLWRDTMITQFQIIDAEFTDNPTTDIEALVNYWYEEGKKAAP